MRSDSQVKSVAGKVPNGDAGPPVARVQDIDRWANNGKWGTVNFFHPDLRHVNR